VAEVAEYFNRFECGIKMASIALESTLDPDPLLSKSDVSVAEFERNESSSDVSTLETDKTDTWIYPHPTDFKLTERPIDAVRELNVAVIGAGLTGECTCRH
jgi:hypothetical protein